jgi:nicotinamide phosphoribosyltransferase
MSFRGSDSIIVIPGARYFYGEPENEVCINSVNASEHSVSTTKIFTVGEQQMLSDWMKVFPTGILSVVSDTFDLWKLITEYLPALKDEIMNRDGKLVIRPDSGDPVDIICGNGKEVDAYNDVYGRENWESKGVIELLWDIFGGTVNAQGYKVLDPHIGAIYGDSITTTNQIEIYERLAAKGFAATNIVLGVGSFTYQYNTRDTYGFAAKGAWFQTETETYNIYKDPATDDGTKKSLKGLCAVFQDDNGEYFVETECSAATESAGALQTIYEDGKFYNQTTLTEIRGKIQKLITINELV